MSVPIESEKGKGGVLFTPSPERRSSLIRSSMNLAMGNSLYGGSSPLYGSDVKGKGVWVLSNPSSGRRPSSDGGSRSMHGIFAKEKGVNSVPLYPASVSPANHGFAQDRSWAQVVQHRRRFH